MYPARCEPIRQRAMRVIRCIRNMCSHQHTCPGLFEFLVDLSAGMQQAGMWADSRGHPASKYRQIQAGLTVQMGDVTSAVASSVKGPPPLPPGQPPILLPPHPAALMATEQPSQPSSDALTALRAALGAQASEQIRPALEQAAPPHTPPQVQAGRTFGGPAWGATEVSSGRRSVPYNPVAHQPRPPPARSVPQLE